MASKSLPPHNPHNIFFKKHHSPQKNKLSSDSNPQYIFNFPQKVFIKNQYINLQNSTIRDNHKSFTTLDRLLQEYSKSLSPNTNYNLNIKRRYKNNKRQKSIKNFSCTQKNPSFFQENSNSKSVYNVKNQNNIEELMIKSKKLHIFKKQPKKNYDYLDNLFDDSLRDKETKPREIPFTNKTKYSLNPNIISKNGDPTNNSDSYRRSLSRSIVIFTFLKIFFS